MKNFDFIVAETIRKYKGSISELADKLGIKVPTLYRLANPFDEDAKINSKHLIPLMEETRNYEILKHIASRCGFIVVKLPKIRSKKEEEISEYQERQAVAIKAVIEFFRGDITADAAIEAIRAEMEYAAGFSKAIESEPMLFEEDDNE